MKKSFHSVVGRAIITVATGLTALILSNSMVIAGNANPQTGYLSLYDNILEKGPNIGRCNAIGVLGSLICETTSELLPDATRIINECRSLGIGIEIPDYCLEDPQCLTDLC